MQLNYNKKIKEIIISFNSKINDAIINLDKSGLKISLVVDNKNKLIGTICDGDIRRGLLNGCSLNDKIERIVNKKPIVLFDAAKQNEALMLIRENFLQHLPIINKNNEPIGLYTTLDINKERSKRENKVVVMTGGLGKRLLPATKNKPKGLISIFGKPMLEHVILQIKKSGFVNFTFSINYLGNMIKDHFSSGKKFKVNIDYIEEKAPLGTAGSLCYLKKLSDQTILVTNCDIISDIDYGDALDYHITNSADATMVVRRYGTKNPFGVIKTDGNKFISHEEKPVRYENINAGIYIIETSALKFLEDEKYQEMTDFFTKLSQYGKKVIVYPIYESWSDYGQKNVLSPH